MKSFFKILLAGFIGTLIALLLSGLIFVSILGSIASFSSKKAYNVPSSAILNINFDSVLSERGSDGQFQLQLQSLNSLGASNSSKIGIRKMVQVIDAAAKDPSIKFIYVNAGKINAEGITLVEELRNALIRFRKSGKPVISYAENFSQQGYYLASASDKIYFDSMGMNELLGTSSQVFFLKDILNKLDINIQLIRHGKYKSAGEQFICNDMTP
ncbi:MAG: S49 family peptidase, partial [Bacteroidales bacterium]